MTARRLNEIAWSPKYDSDVPSLIETFYLPALRPAVRYDRSTGYYSAALLKVAARGVEWLVKNGGRMRLVVGCTLGPDEVDAIARGEALKEMVAARCASWPLEPNDEHEVDALELLAWMVAHDVLDVRVAVPCGADRKPIVSDGIFHEKAGIVSDGWGDKLAFQGSVNETLMGWGGTEHGNWESFAVFTSWGPGAVYVEAEQASFERLYGDQAKHARVVDVPTALREDLLRFLPANDQRPKRLLAIEPSDEELPPPMDDGSENLQRDDPVVGSATTAPPAPVSDPERAAFWSFVRNAPVRVPGGSMVGVRTAAVEPWPHQYRAFERMYGAWPPKLLIADEVGLGKTIQAGMLLRQAWLAGRAKRILVLVPRTVVPQWQAELREKFNLSWPIYDGHRLLWPTTLAGEETTRVVGADAWPDAPCVIVSSHLVRRKERAARLLAAEPWDLVILDEAHHARRKGAGGAREEGPNRLLALMRQLKERTAGLVLLTATPMQVHPVEIWDLLALLGLPAEWSPSAFEKFFELASAASVSPADLEMMARLFRAAERHFGRLPDAVAQRLLPGLAGRKLMGALRDDAESPRRQLSAERRAAALKVLREGSPVGRLVSRNTRELLRKYIAEGKLTARIAQRKVEDCFVEMTAAERQVYDDVEAYIASTWNNAKESERNAIGFVMTIYRRRLASSFAALAQTLRGRLAAVRGGYPAFHLDEDVDDDELGDEPLDDEQAAKLAKVALGREEAADIDSLLRAVERLPLDTKAKRLLSVIETLEALDHRQCIVFTQFTDTLDFLRAELVRAGRRVMCFSGRGGEIMAPGGKWQIASRDETKRRFRRGEADILVCTDAAAEGLNFQFCGALVNYDLPWNPMRVEQRIGRIDRLGQKFDVIHIANLHYRDTVETDVYVALANRIGLFTQVVGRLQPILSTLPGRIASAVLHGESDPQKRRRLVDDIDAEVDAGTRSGFDLDALSASDFEPLELEEPACDLVTLERALSTPGLLPPEWRATPLHAPGEWTLFRPGREPLRVTSKPELFEQHPTSYELWSVGSPVFPPEGFGVDE